MYCDEGRTRIGRVLVESMARTGNTAADLDPCDWDALWVSARDHCLAPYLHKCWTDSGFISALPPSAAARFSNARVKNAERNRRLLEALDELRSALSGEGIPIIVSKGLPVAQAYYGDLGLRVMYDLDLMVRFGDKAGALGVLRKLGYVPFFAGRRASHEATLLWRPQAYGWDAESVFDPEQPCFVELHTRPWQPGWHGYRLECNLDLWQGKCSQQVGFLLLTVPAEAKLLVHLAVHYACNVLESNARLMHLMDIALILRLRKAELDWHGILCDIEASRAAPFCLLAFDLAGRVGGGSLPPWVLSELRRSTPRRILDWLDARGIEDAGSMNLRDRHRALIYFLHWNMAAGWRETAGVLLHSLRTPWLESNGEGRWRSLFNRMTQRVQTVASFADPWRFV